MIRNSFFTVVFLLLLTSQVFGQGEWLILEKEDIGIESVEPVIPQHAGSPYHMSNDRFFHKYDAYDTVFYELENDEVFYLHNDTLISVSNITSPRRINTSYNFTVNDSLMKYYQFTGAPEYKEENEVFIDSRRNIWVIPENDLFLFKNEAWIHYTDSTGIRQKQVEKIIEDRDNKIWVLTTNGAPGGFEKNLLSYFSENKWHHQNRKSGFSNKRVRGVELDRDKYLWAQISDKAIAKFNGFEWEKHRAKKDLPGYIFDFEVSKNGSIWVTLLRGLGRNGVGRYYKGNWSFYNKDNNLLSNNVGIVGEDPNGHMWLLSSHGLNRFDGKEFIAYPIKGVGVEKFMNDKENNLWVISSSSLLRFKNNKLTDYSSELDFPNSFDLEPLQMTYITEALIDLHEDKQGSIWLYRYTLSTKDTFLLVAAIAHLSKIDFSQK
jgi:hypothetical protein